MNGTYRLRQCDHNPHALYLHGPGLPERGVPVAAAHAPGYAQLIVSMFNGEPIVEQCTATYYFDGSRAEEPSHFVCAYPAGHGPLTQPHTGHPYDHASPVRRMWWNESAGQRPHQNQQTGQEHHQADPR